MKCKFLKRFLVALLCCIPQVIYADSSLLTPVTVQLKWTHQFQFAGFYAAIENGYYEEVGLDVTLIEASPEINPVTEVSAGRADYGVANSELLLHKLNGSEVTAIAVTIQHSPLVLLALRSSHIRTPQDLVGRRVMFPDGAYGANTLGVLKNEGVMPEQIIHVPLSFDINDLISGKVDAMVGYLTDQPYQLLEQGVDYLIIDPRNYGIDFYGDTIFTSSQYLKKHPHQVKAFRAATLKGWEYAVSNPDKISNLIIQKYRSSLSYEQLMFEARETIKLMVPDLVEIGHMNPERWQHIAKTFVSLGMADEPVSLDGFIYNPDKDLRMEMLYNNLWIVMLVIGFVLLSTVLLSLFNRRLKMAVNLRTAQLTESNNRLLSQTDELIKTQGELNRLNHALEDRVAERTRALEGSNQSLIREVAERKARELSLRLLSRAVENSGSAILISTKEFRIHYVNSSFLDKTGYGREVLADKFLSEFKTVNGEAFFPESLLNKINTVQVREELECVKASGEVFWAQVSVSPVLDSNQRITHYVFVCEDISLFKQRKEEMERLAFYDPLTGLENRLLFNMALEKALIKSERDKTKFAVLFIDLDHFKRINDEFGHDGGDQVLKVTAIKLKKHIRKNDSFARISGDEFAILLNDIKRADDVRTVVFNMLNELKEPIKFFGREIIISLCVGVTIAPDDGDEPKVLMKNADLAMYRAKKLGRNDFRFFSEDMNEELSRNMALEVQITKGIEQNEFFLLFQPQISLETGKLIGLEALVRWSHPERGILEPIEFICFAEESGLIVSLGKLVNHAAFEAGVEILRAGLKDLRVAINLSPRQLYDSDFLCDIQDCLDELKIEGGNFEFEITESCLIDRAKTNIRLFSALKEMGFSLSIDDFGTGYSSLSYLKQLPIDCIKIDKSFIGDIPQDSSDVEITAAVIAMAHKLNLSVTAEGVETVLQEAFLKENNCDYVQGYYYDKPMLLADVLKKYLPAN